MTDAVTRTRSRGPIGLGELVGRVISPVSAKRGFATADLIAAWTDVVGSELAAITRPERIAWPRGKGTAEGAVLHLRVDGPRAVLVQHQLGQVIDRVNGFLGYAAVAKVRLVQGPLAVPPPAEAPAAIGDKEAAQLAATTAAVENDSLRAALDRLGRGVLARR